MTSEGLILGEWVTNLNFVDMFDVGVKALLVVFLVLYSLFSLIVIRQIQLLTNLLGTSLSVNLKMFAIFHVIISLALLLFVVFTL